MAPLPGQALLRVVRGPDVVGRQRVDAAGVVDRPVGRNLGPRADPHAVGLLEPAVVAERMQRRLAVSPDALLERPAQLRLMGLADEVVALLLERRVQEEAVVLETDALRRLARSLAERDELLAFGKRADGHGPFLEGNWHVAGRLEVLVLERKAPRVQPQWSEAAERDGRRASLHDSAG